MECEVSGERAVSAIYMRHAFFNVLQALEAKFGLIEAWMVLREQQCPGLEWAPQPAYMNPSRETPDQVSVCFDEKQIQARNKLCISYLHKKWNSPRVEEPAEKIDIETATISELFEVAVKNSPAADAIHAWDGQLSYSDVHKYAKAFAYYLSKRGVKAEALIACCMDKSLWTCVAMVAVNLAGGAIILVRTRKI